ncbi:MAG: DUF1564 family protein [Leptospiraceae bacterium]|nr:DUF1564 family protein [Leptospiraceae bacterium]
MMLFQNSDEFLLEEIEDRNHTVSTLLVPENLMPSFQVIVKNHGQGNISLYLRNLLFMYRTLTHSGMIPKPITMKTEYQEEGQNLCRVGFRPANSDWIELGELALAFGKSRCWLFTYLLKMDIMGLWYLLAQADLIFAVPTFPNLELQSFWTLLRNRQSFARNYHVKV